MDNDNLSSGGLRRLLSRLKSRQATVKSALQIDRLLRSHCVGEEFLAVVNDFQLFAVASDEKEAALGLLVERSIQFGNSRLKGFRPRSLWGVTPIIQLTHCAKADRLLGIDAETLVYTTYHITSDFDINLKVQIEWICANCPEKLTAFQWMVLWWALLSYDIFHFYNDRGLLANVGGYGSDRFGISLEEMQVFRRAGKLLYTYAYGADHRMRQATQALGKYNFCMDCPEVGKFCLCDDVGGKTMLATIGSYATAMIATGIAMKLIPNAKNLFYLVLDINNPRFRAPRRRQAVSPKLRIAHAPNHGFFKGTQRLLDAVERLQARGVPLELVTISGVPNEQVLELIASCDVLADQFISGSFGYTALEAMAQGVPVMCYLSPDIEFPEPEALPIINCHPEHIDEAILQLVETKESLLHRGLQSRAYVERNYSIEAFGKRLAGLYQDTAYWEIRETCKHKGIVPAKLRFFSSMLARRRDLRGPRRSLVPFAVIYGPMLKILRRNFFMRFVKRPGRCVGRNFSKAILTVAAALGKRLTQRRLKKGCPRSMWGVTPILTLPLLARCDRMLGIRSESVVFTTYHITSAFDVNFGKITDWAVKHAPFAYPLLQRLILAWALLRYDVFHYFYDRGILAPVDYRFGINPEELDALTLSGKHLFCYAYGADVRTRDTTLHFGKWNLCTDCPEPMKYCICGDALGAVNMSNIANHATAMISMGDMLSYVPGARNQHYWPIDIARLSYVGVNRLAGAPLRVAHVPNHSHFKGTAHLDAAISRLQVEGFSVEILRAQGVTNQRVIEIYSEADVVADQFIAGFHGYAALEAMALGKPVLCYLRGPEMMLSPDDCPIINTSPDNLYETLRAILEGKLDLKAIGNRGRRYIEKYYSLEATATRQGEMYSEMLFSVPYFGAPLQERINQLRSGMDLEIRQAAS